MSKKISQLTAATTNNSTDNFVFRRSNNNYRIAYSDLVAELGVISGLTTGYIPVATSATSIGNSYLHQTAGSIIIADGKTITSVNGNSVLNFYSGLGIGFEFFDGTNSGTIKSDNLASTFAWDDGVNDGGVTAQATNLLVHHTGKITLDAPILECLHLTVSTLPFVDTSQYLKSSTIVADGNNLSFTSGHGIDTTVTVGTDTLDIGITNANAINYGNSSTTHTFLGTVLDANAMEVQALSFRVNGTGGNGHIDLKFQSAIPTGVASTNKLFAGAAGQIGWVIDNHAYAFYIDPSAHTASRTLTAPDVSGTIAITSNKLSDFAATTSAELAGVISDETGYAAGAFLVFSKSPTIDAPTFSTSINGSYLTASSIVETDASKNLVSVAKNTAYNKAFGTTAGTVAEGNDARFTGYSVSHKIATVFVSPAASTTYYIGSGTVNALNTTADIRRIYVSKPGTITVAKGFLSVAGTLSSAHNSSLYIRLNDTTDYLVSNTVTTTATKNVITNTALSIAVVDGDYYEWKLVTGAFTTAPTNVSGEFTAHIS